jgi:hypothetical protein
MLAIDPVLHHLPQQRVAVNAQNLAGFGLIVFGAPKNPFDHPLLDDFHGLFEEESPVYQMIYERVETFFHGMSGHTVDQT